MPAPSPTSTLTRAAAVLAAAVAVAAPVRAQAPGPWEAQPFAADAAAVLAAARAAVPSKTTADVVVLYEESRYVFDEQGRCDYRYRLAFSPRTDGGAKDWATLSAQWAPWHEARPTLRARVVTVDGAVHELDPATVAEAGVGGSDPAILTDRRELRAPLPAIARGAVVEEEIRVPDREPLFAAGSQYRVVLGNGVPTVRMRVVVDAPETLPLRHVLRGGGFTIQKEKGNGRLRLEVVAGPLEPLPRPEADMPSDRPRAPYLAFSTGASWAHVAGTYARIVDAQLGGVSPAPRPGVAREEVAARLLKQLHAEVRYTGVEFGAAAMVPRRPAEVLARKYGDCKDKAALLASRLRAAGLPAHLALLWAGPGPDVEPELPGFGVFDHVIVYLPGPKPLWIDATAEYGRVNELPGPDQGRLALVAAPDTAALVKTPVSTSSDNVVRKTREYALGADRVIETTTVTGGPEREYRAYYAETDPKDIREGQEKYLKAAHNAAVLASKVVDPRDLQSPFVLTVEGKRDGASEDGQRVTIDPSGLLSRLPAYVGGDDEQGTPRAPRREPFVFTQPHRIEWTYRVVPPSGAALKRLPEAEHVALGTSTFDARFATKPDGVVEATLAFDSGPREVDAATFQAMEAAVRRLRARGPFMLEFEDRAAAFAQAGRTCDALGERRAAAAREPRAASPQERLANALLESGFGEPAREAARRATAIDPRSSSAQRTLGWVLEHDLLGRRFKPGWDRKGAEAAYRRAKELDPKDALPRMSLAILLEHNEVGVHYGVGSRLAEAAEEEKAYRAEIELDGLDTNLALSLMHLGRFEEMEAHLRSMRASASRDELIVAAVAARRGAREAVKAAATLFENEAARRDGLLHAGNSLLSLRLYPAGSALLAESAAGAPDAAARRGRADLFARVRRSEDVPLDDADPRTVVKRLFVAMAAVGETGDDAQLLTLVAPRDETMAAGDPAANRLLVRRMLRAAGASARFDHQVADLVLSLGEFSAQGDPWSGYRVRIVTGDSVQSAWVVRRDGRFKVLTSGGEPGILALEAWKNANGGDPAVAAQYLDWLREELAGAQSDPDDPVDGPVFLELWRPTPGGRADATAVRVAAASELRGERVAQGLQALQAWRAALADPAARFRIDRALLSLASRAGRPADTVEVAKRLLAAAPTSRTAWLSAVGSLRSLGRLAEARALAEERLARKPDDPMALRELAELAAAAGQYGEADRAYAKIASLGRTTPGDLNNRAWNAVFRGAVDDTAVEWGRQAAEKSGAAALNTLATLYAERGRAAEAMQVLAKGIAATVADEPSPADWYVVGRLAEHCGMPDAARQSYTRASADESGRLDSPSVLARRGLARLGSPPPEATAAAPAAGAPRRRSVRLN